MSHILDPLLKPRSVALLGASERESSPGRMLAELIIQSDYSGGVYPVNPGYSSILGKTCYPDLASLPQTVEQVIIALGTDKLEVALRQTIDHGARAATIFAGITLDSDPDLLKRMSQLAKDAGLQICGANGMGFYNIQQHLYAGLFPKPPIPGGSISHIAQSGTAFSTLAHNGCRLGFNLCVSSGNEMTTTVADCMDWSLDQPETRLISLFLETVRDPNFFIKVLHKAREKQIPIVVLKIGKSALAAKMAISHTGAIAGNHAAFNALFKRYGVIEVEDMDEMAATLTLMQHVDSAIEGQFAAMFESGGLREMVADLADDIGVDFAPLEDETRTEISRHLDHGLTAENPLDAWGSPNRFEERFAASLKALMLDPNVGAGAFISSFRDDYYLHEAIYRVVEQVSRQVKKPIALATAYSDLANAKMSRRAYAAGLPLIEGAKPTLLAFKHLFEYHQFLKEDFCKSAETEIDSNLADRCRDLFQSNTNKTLDENSSLNLLAEFGIPIVPARQVDNKPALVKAGREIGYPLVLKTAEPGIHHKSECGGVVVGITDEQSLLEHYADISHRLGSRVQIAKMIENGVEISVGCVNDPQFGPFVVIAAGGVLVELLDDQSTALCPVSADQVKAQIETLKIHRLLKGYRGQPAVDIDALASAIALFSQFASQFQQHFSEIDINPLLVNVDGCFAVDALIVK